MRRSRSMYTVTVNSKGQLTVPAPLRRTLGFDHGCTLALTVEDDDTLRFVRQRRMRRKEAAA